MKKYILIALLIFLFSVTRAWSESIMIVNESVSVDELTRSDAAKIFLGKKKSWDNGHKIIAVTLKKGSTHNEFIKKIVKKNSSQFAIYWKRMVFTGRGQALKTFDSEQDLVSFIAQNPGSTGYISKDTPHPGVKQVAIK